ncbi:MAG: class I SAM-dependent methyltransferase [Ruminococcus sp.]|nr:class I SAM-dependent methyltransferase [Ruminococcus sp.]
MLDSKGFDLWADDYDKSVNLCEESDEYPFAGYKDVLGTVYQTIKSGSGKKILDVGFGTGILAKRLYDEGYSVYGMDFSEKMIEIAAAKMPEAVFCKHDFTKGFPDAFADQTFDFIICTYAIHHLDTPSQLRFIKELMQHLTPQGQILIGDVAFETIEELEHCRQENADEWDDEEFYPVVEKLRENFSDIRFEKISFCAGVLFIFS